MDGIHYEQRRRARRKTAGVLWVPAWAAVVLAMSLTATGMTASAGTIGTITNVRGTVTIKRSGQGSTRIAAAGDEFDIGDVLGTAGDGAAQATFSDDSFMNLGAGSQVRVLQYSFDLQQNRRTADVSVLEGRVRFIVFKLRMNDSSLRVETTTASLIQTGLGDFIVLVSPPRTDVLVLQGGLNVSNVSPLTVGAVQLGVNQRAFVDLNSTPGPPQTVSPKDRKEALRDVQ